MPTSVPAKNDRNAITPAVPAITESPPEPKETSARMFMISRRYRRTARGVHASARR